MSSQPGAPAASSPTTVVPLDGRPAGAGRGSFSSGSSANGSSTSSMMPTPPVAVQVDMAGPSSPAPGAATAAALLCHSRDVKGDGVGHAVGGNDVVSNGGNAGAEGKQCDVLSGTSMANGRNPTNNAQVVNILATTGCTVGQDVEYELAALPDTLQTALLQFAGVDTKKLKVSGAPVPKKVSRKRLQEAIVAVDQRRRVRRGLQCVVGVLCLACFLMLLCIACIIPGTGGGNSLSEATELSSSNPTLLVDGTDMAVRTASADIEAGNDLGVMYSRKTGTPMQVDDVHAYSTLLDLLNMPVAVLAELESLTFRTEDGRTHLNSRVAGVSVGPASSDKPDGEGMLTIELEGSGVLSSVRITSMEAACGKLAATM